MGLRYCIIIACLGCCSLNAKTEQEAISCVISEGQKLVGVKELRSNDSPEIRTILQNAGFDTPNMYCSATVKYLYDICGILTQVTAWSPTAVPEDRAVWKGGKTITRLPRPADSFGIYSPRKGRVSHAGIVFHWPENGNYFLTIEGNVSTGDGEGITILRRKKSDIYIVCNWIDDNTVSALIAEAEEELDNIPSNEMMNIPNAEKLTPEQEEKKKFSLLTLVVFGVVVIILIRYASK